MATSIEATETPETRARKNCASEADAPGLRHRRAAATFAELRAIVQAQGD
jgi:hypothetical protein